MKIIFLILVALTPGFAMAQGNFAINDRGEFSLAGEKVALAFAALSSNVVLPGRYAILQSKTGYQLLSQEQKNALAAIRANFVSRSLSSYRDLEEFKSNSRKNRERISEWIEANLEEETIQKIDRLRVSTCIRHHGVFALISLEALEIVGIKSEKDRRRISAELRMARNKLLHQQAENITEFYNELSDEVLPPASVKTLSEVMEAL